MRAVMAVAALAIGASVLGCNDNKTGTVTNPPQDFAMAVTDSGGGNPGDMATGGMTGDMATGGMTGDMARSMNPMTAAVDVRDNLYSPSTVTIAPGGTVTWTWKGNNPHTVTSNMGVVPAFDSGAAKSSGTFSMTFPTAGSFGYHCNVHGLAMAGTVVVQ